MTKSQNMNGLVFGALTVPWKLNPGLTCLSSGYTALANRGAARFRLYFDSSNILEIIQVV